MGFDSGYSVGLGSPDWDMERRIPTQTRTAGGERTKEGIPTDTSRTVETVHDRGWETEGSSTSP